MGLTVFNFYKDGTPPAPTSVHHCWYHTVYDAHRDRGDQGNNDDDRKSSLYIREKRYTRSYFCDKVLYYRRANSEMSFYMENYLNLSSYMESYFCNEVLHGELLQKWGSNKELLQ